MPYKQFPTGSGVSIVFECESSEISLFGFILLVVLHQDDILKFFNLDIMINSSANRINLVFVLDGSESVRSIDRVVLMEGVKRVLDGFLGCKDKNWEMKVRLYSVSGGYDVLNPHLALSGGEDEVRMEQLLGLPEPRGSTPYYDRLVRYMGDVKEEYDGRWELLNKLVNFYKRKRDDLNKVDIKDGAVIDKEWVEKKRSREIELLNKLLSECERRGVIDGVDLEVLIRKVEESGDVRLVEEMERLEEVSSVMKAARGNVPFNGTLVNSLLNGFDTSSTLYDVVERGVSFGKGVRERVGSKLNHSPYVKSMVVVGDDKLMSDVNNDNNKFKLYKEELKLSSFIICNKNSIMNKIQDLEGFNDKWVNKWVSRVGGE